LIPFRDYNPSGTFPTVTLLIIVANVAVFLHQTSQSPGEQEVFVRRYGLRPVYVTAYVTHDPRVSDLFLPIFLPFATCMFLHGGWMHLIGNMWYLWIFGDNVEDRMGHGKFLLFYLACGLGASIAHIVVDSHSTLPMVGASGAIAGVLGAYAVAFPKATVSCLLPIFIIWTVIQLPALIVLGFWFLIQFLSGMQSLRMPGVGGVAWWAHIGGFVLGMLLLPLLQKPRVQRRQYLVRRR